MAIGKALGGGVPVGATLVSEDVAKTVSFGDHGSTFGGNLLACRAALTFLNKLVAGGLLTQIGRTGAHLERMLHSIAQKQPRIVALRGAGLMWGIELDSDAAPVVEAALNRGLLINRTAGTVLRLLPPLTITESEIDSALAILESVLADERVKVLMITTGPQVLPIDSAIKREADPCIRPGTMRDAPDLYRLIAANVGS